MMIGHVFHSDDRAIIWIVLETPRTARQWNGTSYPDDSQIVEFAAMNSAGEVHTVIGHSSILRTNAL